MLPEGARNSPLFALILFSLSLLCPLAIAHPSPSVLISRSDDPVSKNSSAYLPAQIGGIVGAYAVSLVLVAITLLALSKKRREHLLAANDDTDFAVVRKNILSPDFAPPAALGSLNIVTATPAVSEFNIPGPYIYPSPTSTVGRPGVSPLVDQRVVDADRVMAQSQLEEMYKHVMEHEDAKKRGVVYEAPILPVPSHPPRSSASGSASIKSSGTLSKKERNKPANLNLGAAREEKTQSRASSILSALRSPKKKPARGLSISSPMMTPQSATFPRHPESQEMSTIPPRHYAPPPPPPVPTDQVPFGAYRTQSTSAPMTPDISPESVMSIDERIGNQLPQVNHHRSMSQAPTECDPESATSEHSQAALVGLPTSPKPGARFPTLPSSPKPGATFQRSNAPSAVRTGGTLPLRAYEPAMASPRTLGQTTKQTVFERKGPLSPSGAMTPYTAGAVPYSPYQPFTPLVPMTPSLVTKDDRKRMRRMVPKTPTMELVQSPDDIW
ncbi:hypothetical protein G7046_g9860 [Stylonectria norvegica]|nr:hypothetical protein G7046_g9860 [Stylonectria norvegica]